jgi:hypothetical protein
MQPIPIRRDPRATPTGQRTHAGPPRAAGPRICRGDVTREALASFSSSSIRRDRSGQPGPNWMQVGASRLGARRSLREELMPDNVTVNLTDSLLEPAEMINAAAGG